MRKIILDLAVSLDGFIEGSSGETDWCILDDDMGFDAFLAGLDAIFYGRKSYEAWGHYVPQEGPDLPFWNAVHQKKKYVFSCQNHDDDRAVWISGNLAEKVAHLKAQEGKDIWLYGGAGLIQSFIQLGLVDLYRISVHPIALGKGKPLFEDLKGWLHLKLIDTCVFRSGVVQLIYKPEENSNEAL